MVIDIGVNWKVIRDFLFLLIVSLVVSVAIFEILTLKARNIWFFHTSPFFDGPVEGTRSNFWMKFTRKNYRDGATVWWKFHDPIFNRTDFTDLNLYWIKGTLALFVLVSGYVC